MLIASSKNTKIYLYISMAISTTIWGILISSSIEKISFIGVVSARNARQEKPPMILAMVRNPRLKPSAVTARLNIPKFRIAAPVPKNIAIKTNVINANENGTVMNFK
jgi:hypothetical protein